MVHGKGKGWLELDEKGSMRMDIKPGVEGRVSKPGKGRENEEDLTGRGKKIRSQAVEPYSSSSSSLSSKTPSPPSKLFESDGASSKGPYPGGLGPYTGRDPNVKKPEWLRQRAPQGERFQDVKESLSRLKLNTVCEEAQCPNIGECWNGGGDGIANRNNHASWGYLHPCVDYIVLTSVDRDDLPDGGSGHFARTVKAMKIETAVKSLADEVKSDMLDQIGFIHPQTELRVYEQSLSVLKHAKVDKKGMITKSSIMLGLGESDEELKQAMADLRAIDVDILTLGQYLQVLNKSFNFCSQTRYTNCQGVCYSGEVRFLEGLRRVNRFSYVASGPWFDPSQIGQAELLLRPGERNG
ncbi:hypothetical protein HHK36_001493 [Tetracentron sinense]|uniref:Lipoyl synthase N-terminal domain-containing protein n=1 Tax=Tetracentron sinense TaxID=13715 RepID=A0A835DR68_TETSI|nr:hypothetical protein HHK36_001493 [Tetracentron sinense]